jgi:hypothetical protein
MLTCYLDDSGKDAQNPITTVAGFIARNEQWAKFEKAAELHFTEFNVKLLHTVDLYHTAGEFKDWTLLKKQFFVGRLCREMSSRVLQGLTMSARKTSYSSRAAERRRSPLTHSVSTSSWIGF